MRNDLNGGAQVIAVAFLIDNTLIDFAGGYAVRALGRHTGKPFIMAEIKVSFGAVVGYKDFAVLIRAHSAGIDVQVRIQLAQTNLKAPRLQNGCQRSRRQPLAERRNDTAGNENEFCFG